VTDLGLKIGGAECFHLHVDIRKTSFITVKFKKKVQKELHYFAASRGAGAPSAPCCFCPPHPHTPHTPTSILTLLGLLNVIY
jgi:hypothetical protein